jgi:uridine kinase
LDADLPTYDRLQRASGPRGRLKLNAEETLVLEGVPALLVEWPTERPIHKIYVEADEVARSARVIDDIVRRGVATMDGAQAIYEGRLVDEVTPVQETRERADFVVRLDTNPS